MGRALSMARVSYIQVLVTPRSGTARASAAGLKKWVPGNACSKCQSALDLMVSRISTYVVVCKGPQFYPCFVGFAERFERRTTP